MTKHIYRSAPTIRTTSALSSWFVLIPLVLILPLVCAFLSFAFNKASAAVDGSSMQANVRDIAIARAIEGR